MHECSDIIIVLVCIDRAQALMIHSILLFFFRFLPCFNLKKRGSSEHWLETFLCHEQLTQSVWWRNESVCEHIAFFVISQKWSHLSSHLPFRIISDFSPGMSFCNMLNVSHASHRSLSNSALWSSGASICSDERALYSFRLPYVCVHVCLYAWGYKSLRCGCVRVCVCVCMVPKYSAPVCICVFALPDSWALPAAVELVISRSCWRAMKTNSTDVTSPPGWVLTESITTTPLRDCLQ